jgi:hypothetical protein
MGHRHVQADFHDLFHLGRVEVGIMVASRFPGLVRRVLRETSDDAMARLLDECAVTGMTIPEYIEARAEAMAVQLVKDAAPKALQELRRLRA